MSNVFIKTKVRSGSSAVKYLQNLKGRRIMVVCDKFLAENGAVRYITDVVSANNQVEIFNQAIPDPTIEVVGRGLTMICKSKPDVLIGFGGGSAIDTAKGIIYFAGVKELVPKPLFITVPTTSGTGSEVTSAAVITDSDAKVKHLITTDDILADVALLDAQLTLSVPAPVTANTGMDVLTHALEAYVATRANVFSDALAEKAMELLTHNLLACYQNGKNLAVRTAMHEASTLAGMAFNNAGLGVNHSIAHQLGSTFHIPHGLANAILLNQVIDYNCANRETMEKYAVLAKKLQLAPCDASAETAVAALKLMISMLMQCMHMAAHVSELKISREEYQRQIPTMVENALMDHCINTTPRNIGTMGIRNILEAVY